MRILNLSLTLLVSSVLTGCMVGPNFHSPAAPQTQTYTKNPLPKKTVSIPNAGKAGKSQQLISAQDIPGEWWTLFHSPALNQLITQGLANSPNLAAAQATLSEAQENLREQIGNLLFPSVNLQLSAQRSRSSGLAFGSTTIPPTIYNSYNTSIPVSYVLDIFGGSRRQIEALRAQVDYQRYELIAAYLTLTTNIVTTSISVASLQAQVQATQDLIQAETETLKIIKQQLHVGGASVANVLSQQTLLAQTEASLPPLKQALIQAQDSLAILVGKIPSQAQLPTFRLSSLTLPTRIPVSLPSNLVRQRPDIQASEALLHAASAQIGVATANLFPQVTLSANYGWIAQAPVDLLKTSSNVWSLSSQLLQPIFHGGALLAARRAAIDAYNQSYQQYRQTVLQAFQNVSDSLWAIQNDAEEFKAEKLAETSAKETLVITRQQYKVGGASYLQVLSAEQQYQQALTSSIKAETARYSDTAALFQALGGGWWNSQAMAPPTPKKNSTSSPNTKKTG